MLSGLRELSLALSLFIIYLFRVIFRALARGYLTRLTYASERTFTFDILHLFFNYSGAGEGCGRRPGAQQ